MSIHVYFSTNEDRFEYEAVNKGYRKDVYVVLGDAIYHVHVYDKNRLQQDFDTELERYGFYYTDPNLVLVSECSAEQIKRTLDYQHRGKYFSYLKPMDLSENDKVTFIESLFQI